MSDHLQTVWRINKARSYVTMLDDWSCNLADLDVALGQIQCDKLELVAQRIMTIVEKARQKEVA